MPHVRKAYKNGSLFIGPLHENGIANMDNCDHCGEYLSKYDMAIVYTTREGDTVFHTFHFPDQSQVVIMVRSLRAEERLEEKHQKAIRATNRLWEHAQTFDGQAFHSPQTAKNELTISA